MAYLIVGYRSKQPTNQRDRIYDRAGNKRQHSISLPRVTIQHEEETEQPAKRTKTSRKRPGKYG